MDVRGRRILITGASSGIGRALAVEWRSRGAEVLGTARAGEAHAADLSIPGAAAALAAAVGAVDVLVNCAGSGVPAPATEPDRATFELNYWSPLALIDALRPRAVVNVTSLAVVTPWPLSGGYAASKAALAVATETLRNERPDVHVLHVIPGPVDTPAQAVVRQLPGTARLLDRLPMGTAAGCARRVADALERDRERVVYPRVYAVGLALPGLTRWVLRRAGP